MTTGHLETTYERWLRQEEIPVVTGYSVEDLASLPLQPWARLGGRAAAIQLVGMEGLTGVYVVEVPPGETLSSEKHLYEELMYVVSGRGATQVWSGEDDEPPEDGHSFEWGAGSLFAPPLNAWHSITNVSPDKPARLVAVTSAPLVMDLFHNLDFVFGCDYRFTDRYDGRPGYFEVSEDRQNFGGGWLWETNLIPDVTTASVDPQKAKGPGSRVTWYQMSDGVLVGHMAGWPPGQYNKAHHHAGGQILLCLRSHGYTLLWPPEAGIRPYEAGHEDMVIRLEWREGSMLCPPSGWFHQHFNTGPTEARQLALRYGSKKYGVGFKDVLDRKGVLVSVREGGTQIEFDDEDPRIREDYRRELARDGVEYRMPVE